MMLPGVDDDEDDDGAKFATSGSFLDAVAAPVGLFLLLPPSSLLFASTYAVLELASFIDLDELYSRGM
jgi:hypothetical protein